MSSMFSIEKLAEDNYESWRMQIKAVLIHQDLWELVSDKDNAERSAEWKRRDEKAMATVILSVTPIQLSYIKSCKSAREAWDSLSQVHRPKGPVRKVSLFKQLLGMRMNEGDGIQEYLCEFTSVVDQLHQTGIELAEELLVIIILASLPVSFENFVVALESRDDLPKLCALKVKLSEESERRKSSANVRDDCSNQAFMTHSKRNSNNNGKDRKSNAQNRNVKRSNNKNAGSKKSDSRTSRSNFKCYNCGGRGHYAVQCSTAEKKGKPRNPNEHAYTVRSMSNNNNVSKNIWCLDSGASSNLCCDHNVFTTFEHHREKISLAGKQTIEAKGRGRVLINEGDIELNDVLFVPDLQCNFISVGRVAAKDDVIFEKNVPE